MKYDDIRERIRRACVALNNESCYGQTVELPDGNIVIMHRLSLEFTTWSATRVEDDKPLVSKLVSADKKIVLYLDSMEVLIGNDKNVYSAVLRALAGRVMFREVWWYNKTAADHETTLEHLMSPESATAFVEGYGKGYRTT